MKHAGNLSIESDVHEALPKWVPESVKAYLQHVANGETMRSVAKTKSGHASTISRQVKRLETRRDDPLVDAALQALESPNGAKAMVDDVVLGHEARRVLRRLCENGAFIIVAAAMEKAAIMKENQDGTPRRMAVLDQNLAEAFALKDWIERTRKGKISVYRITHAGRTALKRMLAMDDNAKSLSSAKIDPFQEQHKDWSTSPGEETVRTRSKRIRYNLAESPVSALGRRKGSDGKPFLSADLIQAGEQLREDFEMAQMGPRVTQNWDRFLTAGGSGGFADNAPCQGPSAARARVADAMKFLGPGLGDIALRCCCFLEGMKAAEKRMGWSARSGKIVLRIALQRLKLHYDALHGSSGPRIG